MKGESGNMDMSPTDTKWNSNPTDTKWDKLGRQRSEPLLIEEDKQEPFKCWSYSRSTLLTTITCVLCILTVGFLILVLYWKPNWRLKMMYSRCHLHEAEAVLIQDLYSREHVKYIHRLKLDENRSPELSSPCINFYRDFQAGLSDDQVKARQIVFGLNTITIRVKPILVMLVQEVLNPFYIFQIYSISVWIAYEYYSFAACILIMTLVSLTVSLYVTRKESTTLRKMTDSFLKVKILRPNGSIVIQTEDQVVPGDVLVIPPHGCTMSCDAVLINGTCIVNESMLTGESVPVTKVSLSSQQSLDEQHHIYSPELDKRHTLFCGTRVIQTRLSGYDMVKAVVVQTGFSTLKGTLVRSILYPRPMEFKLYRDAMMFVGSYIALAFVGVVYSAWVLIINEASPRTVTLLTMDTLTIAIQPLLPVALTTGMLYAQIRLKKQGIFCISPQRINLSGVLDVVCFDKTGTLTEDGLDLLGFRTTTDNGTSNQTVFSSMETTATSLSACPFLSTMVTCHSLAVIEGKIQGDPMDLKMFQATGWTLDEAEINVGRSIRGPRRQLIRVKPSIISDRHMSEYIILKQFTFSSRLQRMSVIAQSQISREFAGFVKGAPETIVSLCTQQSVANDFQVILESYTSEGFRVLALAWKPLKDNVTASNYQNIGRDELENDLTFLGILIWQNKLKPESSPVINELQQSSIRTIMVTGDNILTAINVAGKCGMLSPDDTITQVNIKTKGVELKGQLEYKKIIGGDLDLDATDISVDDCQVE
ncbi:polyamine-transporting ATPase 13A3-like [Amphiura filiformis]|uniref:polyamine-transporting ATPase 13A3-like n=1 Tax=Amphiura filiformis TaxID=82378 RepID=UPI003B20D3A9